MLTPFSGQPAHLVKRFKEQSRLTPKKPLFFEKLDDKWSGLTYAQTETRITQLAFYMAELGLMPGDHVLLCAENRIDWAVADLAIMAIGCVVVPAYTTNTEDDHAWLIDHSQVKLVICCAGKVGDTLAKVLCEQASVANMILMDQVAAEFQEPKNITVHFLHDIYACGDTERKLDDIFYDAPETEPCCLIYTSGTGGRPKGVLLTHKSIQANIDAAYILLAEGAAQHDAVFLSILPLSHSYEHTAGLHLPIQIAAEVWYCEGRDKIAANLAEVKPTLMTAVPRLYELLHDRITKGVKAKGGLSAYLFWKAVTLGRNKLLGQTLSVTEAFLDKCLDLLVRKKVRQRFGGRLAFFVSGGAALNPDIGSFFLSLGVNILQGYGQTEASPLISANRPGRIRIETVGPAVDGVEIKLAGDGELLARGACLMKGYWRNQEATAETIIDGWLHTGDLAQIDADGFVTITGRKKEMIVNSGGENIAPSRVEAEFIAEPEIAQIMVYGDSRPHLVALIVPSVEVREETKAAQTQNISKAVRRANSRLSGFERVRRFHVLNDEFTIENKMLTPTLKVRRHIISKIYKSKLDTLYGSGKK